MTRISVRAAMLVEDGRRLEAGGREPSWELSGWSRTERERGLGQGSTGAEGGEGPLVPRNSRCFSWLTLTFIVSGLSTIVHDVSSSNVPVRTSHDLTFRMSFSSASPSGAPEDGGSGRHPLER